MLLMKLQCRIPAISYSGLVLGVPSGIVHDIMSKAGFPLYVQVEECEMTFDLKHASFTLTWRNDCWMGRYGNVNDPVPGGF